MIKECPEGISDAFTIGVVVVVGGNVIGPGQFFVVYSIVSARTSNSFLKLSGDSDNWIVEDFNLQQFK